MPVVPGHVAFRQVLHSEVVRELGQKDARVSDALRVVINSEWDHTSGRVVNLGEQRAVPAPEIDHRTTSWPQDRGSERDDRRMGGVHRIHR